MVSEGHPLQRRRPLSVFLCFINAKSRPAGTGSSGLRGIYGAGVLDRCMEEGVQFDCCIGVSAGSANMCSYVAGQHGRNKPFYQDYSFRKEYMSVGNLVHKHSYLDAEA